MGNHFWQWARCLHRLEQRAVARCRAVWRGYRFPVFLAVLLVTALTAGQLALLWSQNGRILPNVWAWGVNWGGTDYQELAPRLQKLAQEYASRSLVINVGGETGNFMARELGIDWQAQAAAATLYRVGRSGDFWQDQLAAWWLMLRPQRLGGEVTGVAIGKKQLTAALSAGFAALQAPQDASIKGPIKGEFSVVPAQSGLLPDIDSLVQELRDLAQEGKVASLVLQAATAQPEIGTEQAEKALALIKALQEQPVQLKHQNRTWALSFRTHADWIEVTKAYNRWQEPYLAVSLAEGKVKEYLRREILAKVSVKARNVRLRNDAQGQPIIEGVGIPGVSVDVASALQQLYREVPQGRRVIELQSEVMPAQVIVSPEIKDDLGIKQLIAEGESDFRKSPSNRMHNIKTGMARFNNVLVKPGETFSFNKQLGVVDETTGYKKELVIKEGGKTTLPEYGGGICQVSTTLFRAILNGGFPIPKRQNHSYDVIYYLPPGLDSTVYPPTVDLTFVNDTPGHLLIQTVFDQANHKVYFNIYGTPDGRRVELATTGKYDQKTIKEAIYEPTAELSPGVKKLKPHGEAKVGFSVRWDRKTYLADGTVRQDSFTSRYKAFPAYYWIGKSEQVSGEPAGGAGG